MYNFKISDNERDNNSSTKRTDSSRPEGPPNSDRDFNKILKDRDRDRGENSRNSNKKAVDDDSPLAYETINENIETVKKQMSLFDLSQANGKKAVKDIPLPKKEQKEGEGVMQMASADEMPVETQSKTAALKDKKEKLGKADREKSSLKSALKDDDDDAKTAFFMPKELVDNQINPLALNQQYQVENIASDAKVLASNKMTPQQLIEAIVKAISTMETQGKTDTIVMLKHPPMFEGANVVLTSFESARGEFNIRFENLTQQAKSFMDMQQNQDSLKFALQEKGYAVHIVVNTTLVESPHIVDNTQQPERQQSGEEDENPQKRPKKDNEEA